MKRIAQHIAFWLLYLLLCMNMEWLWVGKLLPDMSNAALWRSILFSSGLTSIPEIMFAYYMMYVGYVRIAEKKVPLLQALLEVLAMVIITIIAIRFIAFYSAKSWAYNGKLAEPEFWDISLMWRLLIYLGFSSGVALSLKLTRKQVDVVKREHGLIQEKLNVELQLLRSQLHPHFLFNTLNNIYALARKKSDDAPETIMKLSELLDFMLYRSNTDTIPVAQEIKFLDDYISLECIRYSNKLSIEFLKDIDNEQAPIAPFLLLPLVENAFKHGAGETRQNSFIHIEIAVQNNMLGFIVRNNFEKREAVINKEKLGLQNVKRRLELLYSDHSIDIREEADSFSVRLNINLDSYGKA